MSQSNLSESLRAYANFSTKKSQKEIFSGLVGGGPASRAWGPGFDSQSSLLAWPATYVVRMYDVAGLKTSADQVKLVDTSSSQMTCDGTKELITKKKKKKRRAKVPVSKVEVVAVAVRAVCKLP